jgi:hypothetical protein
MKQIKLLLITLLVSPLALANIWYVAPIAIDETNTTQQALTRDFQAQLLKSIKVNEYQTGKPVGSVKAPVWLIRTQLLPLSSTPLAGKARSQRLTYGDGEPHQEIVAELLMNGTVVAHIGQGWRAPQVAETPMAERLSVSNMRWRPI